MFFDTHVHFDKADGEDGLVSIVNRAIRAGVDRIIAVGGSREMNDLAVEGSWVWSNGEPVAYTNWSPGEPNDSAGEDCQQILWSGYAWNDLNCASALPYVCEALP